MDAMMEPYVRAVDEFPVTGTPAARLRAAIRFAVLAPSSHNSQPWRFGVKGNVLELYADRTRALPVVDPEDRELIMSCGAALHNLLVTLRYFGCDALVNLLPGPPDLLATVTLGHGCESVEEDRALFNAIARRRTNRLPFEARAVPDGLTEALVRAADREGGWLVEVAEDGARTRVAELITAGDRIQMGSRAFRRELAAWMHPSRSASRDGMPGYALGLNEVMSLAAPLMVRTFDMGNGRAAHSSELALGSPLLAVLGTVGDSERHWLVAGQALEHVLLRAEAEGVHASFLNQAIEVPELRRRLGALIGRPGFPQMLLRMGYGPSAKATPRRATEDVLDQGNTA